LALAVGCSPHPNLFALPGLEEKVADMGVTLAQIVIQTLNGVVSGMILALVASGLTLIFGIMDVVNFAHGEFLMLGAYIAVLTLAATHSFWLALLAASLGVGVIGAAIYLTTLRPLLGRDPLTTILATFGISLVLQNYALWQFGPVARKVAEPFSGHFTLFYLDYPFYRLLIAGLSAAIIGAFWLFLKFGTWGIWIRATTQDRIMAQAMGIPVPWVLMIVFAIGSAMAGASGVLFAPLVGVDHAMGFDWILRAFIVVVVGGLGNLGGSVIAAVFISLLEAYASLWVSPAQAVIASFVVLILTLLFRPTGLFAPARK
jgi:branched-chain amino acid transport system permease protein